MLVPINRLSLDVLCLIPMHLGSLSDRLRVTFVCRHWRRMFLQHATLWSQLDLTERMDRPLVKTLLGRVKGSPLDITLDYYKSPVYDLTLLSPLAQQIRSLEIKSACSDEVQDLSVAISGPLPLLDTLKIDAKGYFRGPRSLAAPTIPLFENATNLKNFVLDINKFPSLRHFTFPNITTFNLITELIVYYPVSELLDFLEASPALRWIGMRIWADQFREDVPPGRVIVLPCVETFFLDIISYGPGCEISTHISCPFAKRVEFEHGLEGAGDNVPVAIYPSSTPWNAIVHQYTKGTVERVVLEMTMDKDFNIDCSITFRSSDRTTLKLSYTHHVAETEEEMEAILEWRIPGIFSQALQAIRYHPLLANVKHLYIRGGKLVEGNLELVTNAVGELLGSMGPLENLTLDGCDLRPYLDAFLDTPLFPEAIQPTSFPPIKELAIISPVQSFHDDKVYAAAIVKLARSQYTRGMPFERVELKVPPLVIDKLAAFVDTMEWYDEALSDEDES